MELYLEKCLDSLVKQTLDNIEVIVVNDGSKDNSKAIIEDFQKKYPNIIRAFNKPNGGLSDARNFGIDKATGEYLGFVDSDDYVDHDMYELLYNKALSLKADVAVCQISAVYLKMISRANFDDITLFNKSIRENPTLLNHVKSYAWNKIYKKELFDNFRFPKHAFEDSACIYNLLYTANKIACVDYPLYYYVKEREGSITTNLKNINDIFKSCDSMLDFYLKQSDYTNIKEVVESLCINHLKIRLLYIYQAKDKKLVWNFYHKTIKYLNVNIPGWRKNYILRFDIKKGFVYNAKNAVYRIPGFYKLFTLLPFSLIKKLNKPLNLLIRVYRKLLGKSKRIVESRKQAVQNSGHEVLAILKNLLDEHKILGFADFGTLLGIIREGKLMPFDQDIDYAIINGEPDTTRRILERNEFKLWREYRINDRIVQHSFRYRSNKVDINYYISDDKKSKTWLFYRSNKRISGNTRDVVEMQYSLIKEVESINFKDKTINIPKNAELVLEEKYGKNWRIPDSNWVYWQAPTAIKINEKGYFIEYLYSTDSITNTINLL